MTDNSYKPKTENLDVVQSLLDKWQTDEAHAENESDLPTLPTSLSTDSQLISSLTIEPVSDYGDSCFLVPNLFSTVECERIIADCEAQGFNEMTFIKKAHRGCLRLLATCPSLLNAMWQRIRPFLKPIDFPPNCNPHDLHVQGIPFMLRGRWHPVGLNPLLRICRYTPGQHFGPHYDGHLVRDTACRSLQTCMIYLNAEFEGGSTNFIDESQTLHQDEEGRYCAEEKNILVRVQPQTGLAIIFNHYRLHEGERLTAGLKYILRTDIMFEREDGDAVSEKERQAVELIQKAERYENHKEMDKAVECYRRAFKLCPELETCT